MPHQPTNDIAARNTYGGGYAEYVERTEHGGAGVAELTLSLGRQLAASHLRDWANALKAFASIG